MNNWKNVKSEHGEFVTIREIGQSCPFSLILSFSRIYALPRTIEEGQGIDDALKSSRLIKFGLEHVGYGCNLQMRFFRKKSEQFESNSG